MSSDNATTTELTQLKLCSKLADTPRRNIGLLPVQFFSVTNVGFLYDVIDSKPVLSNSIFLSKEANIIITV